MTDADRTLADTRLVADTVAAARTAERLDSHGFTSSSISDLVARIADAEPYNPAEAFTSPPVGTRRVYLSGIYQLTAPTPGGIAPLGVGDGSPADQAQLVSQATGHAAAAGITGGQGGVVRVVTTSADDPTGTTAGSLRNAILAHQAAWEADQSAASWIVFDPTHGPFTIVLTADLNILSRNLTIDGRAVSVTLNGGGAPGPVPYGYLSGAHSAGTTGLTLTLSATGFNLNASKLRNGMMIDLITADGSRSSVYASNLLVASFDATARTITLNPSTPLTGTVPSGATVIYRGKSQGKLGYAINNGGNTFNDMYGPGRVNIPPGNIIWCDIALESNWGGDVMDTGHANDFRILNWCNPIWLDHMTFTNPSPFHDVMWQNGRGSGGLTVSWCYLHDHYKAINHFNGTDGTGGTDPSGVVTKTHSFPPKPGPDGSAGFYTTTDPGPYRWAVPPTSTHGNTAAEPLVIETSTWHHNYLLHLGNRGPKSDFFTELHFFNNYVKEWGETTDPASNPALQFDWPPALPVTGGSALQSINWAVCLSEKNVFEPYATVVGGGPHRAIATLIGNGAKGYVVDNGSSFLNGAVTDSDVNSATARTKVPDFSSRYSYTLDDPNSTLTARILAGAGANKVSALWQYVGPFSIGSGGSPLLVADEGTTITSAAASLNFAGSGVTATSSGGNVTVTIPGGSGSSLAVQDEGSALTAGATAVNFVGAGVTATNSGSVVTVTVPGPTVVPGQELAAGVYYPTASQTAATTASSTLTDITAAGVTAAWSGIAANTLDCAFTVPASRVLDVETSIYTKGSASGTSVRIGLADGTGTTLAGIPLSLIVANGTVEQRVTVRRRIDLSQLTGGGPAAGTSYTLRPQWAASSGTATLDVGGQNGPVAMRVYAAL